MPEVTSYSTGQPCWADVTNADVAAAAGFYSELFGWEAATDPRPEAGGYTMLTRNGKAVAAASPPPPGAGEMPPHWSVYLAADDVDALAARVGEAGGSLMTEPFDVLDAGRMTVASDPAGAFFGLWQPGGHIGSELRDEHGALAWAEVQTKDRDAVQPFYERVFGYSAEASEMSPGREYVVFNLSGAPAAGLIEIQPEWGEIPSNWSVVFQVDACDAAVAKAQELGGSVVMDAGDVPGVGRFAVLADRWGAVFQLLERSA